MTWMPEGFVPEDYGLKVVEHGGVVAVEYAYFNQKILCGDEADWRRLATVLAAQKDRMIEEIVTDVIRCGVDPVDIEEFSTLHDHFDANIYPSGGWSRDGLFGDEKHGWSDKKGDQHVLRMLVEAPIGKGVEKVDPCDISASESYTGFENALMDGVSSWIKRGGLVEKVASMSGPKP